MNSTGNVTDEELAEVLKLDTAPPHETPVPEQRLQELGLTLLPRLAAEEARRRKAIAEGYASCPVDGVLYKGAVCPLTAPPPVAKDDAWPILVTAPPPDAKAVEEAINRAIGAAFAPNRERVEVSDVRLDGSTLTANLSVPPELADLFEVPEFTGPRTVTINLEAMTVPAVTAARQAGFAEGLRARDEAAQIAVDNLRETHEKALDEERERAARAADDHERTKEALRRALAEIDGAQAKGAAAERARVFRCLNAAFRDVRMAVSQLVALGNLDGMLRRGEDPGGPEAASSGFNPTIAAHEASRLRLPFTIAATMPDPDSPHTREVRIVVDPERGLLVELLSSARSSAVPAASVNVSPHAHKLHAALSGLIGAAQ